MKDYIFEYKANASYSPREYDVKVYDRTEANVICKLVEHADKTPDIQEFNIPAEAIEEIKSIIRRNSDVLDITDDDIIQEPSNMLPSDGWADTIVFNLDGRYNTLYVNQIVMALEPEEENARPVTKRIIEVIDAIADVLINNDVIEDVFYDGEYECVDDSDSDSDEDDMLVL